MKPKLKVLGSVQKTHIMELQLHQRLDTRHFLFEYEKYSAELDPTRLTLYSNQGNYLVPSKNRQILLIATESENEAA